MIARPRPNAAAARWRELIEPGIVHAPLWRRTDDFTLDEPTHVPFLCAVGTKL